MEYRYETKIRPVDFWKLSMYHTYHSLVGMCNLVFGAAMIGLTVRFWNEANDVIQALLFLAWRIYWAPPQDPEEETARPEEAEGEDKEPEDPEA